MQCRQGVYYFRLRVPDELRLLLGRKEFHKSLATTDFKVAKTKVTYEHMLAEVQLDEARRKLEASSTPVTVSSARELSDPDLWSFIVSWFVQKQREDAQLSMSNAQIQERLSELSHLLDPDDTNTASSVHYFTHKFLAEKGVDLPKNAPAFRRLENLLHEAMIEREKRLVMRFVSRHEYTLNPRFAALSAETAVKPAPNLVLSDLVARYLKDLGRTTVSKKAELKREAHFDMVIDVLGKDLPIANIDRKHGRAVFEALLKLPANSSKRFKGMSLAEILDLPPERRGPPISSTTANSYMAAFKALMDFAVNEHCLTTNPANGFSFKSNGEKVKDKRYPFLIADLQSIFGMPLFLGCKDDETGYNKPGAQRPRRGRYWVPLIALFSGMRLNEICQLTEDDLVYISGITAFSVRPADDGSKTVKRRMQLELFHCTHFLKLLDFWSFFDISEVTCIREVAYFRS